jgi:hypothetical protein
MRVGARKKRRCTPRFDRNARCTHRHFMDKQDDKPASVINPFARRPLGVQLSARERVGIAALYLGLALLVGQHVVRSLASPPRATAGTPPTPTLLVPKMVPPADRRRTTDSGLGAPARLSLAGDGDLQRAGSGKIAEAGRAAGMTARRRRQSVRDGLARPMP